MSQSDNGSSSDILSVETLRRFRDGDAVAFQQVHQVFDRRLFAYLRSRFPGLSWQDVEDILQNLWLEILGSRQRFNPADGHRGFSGWVHQIVRLRSIDLKNRQLRHAAVTDPEQLTQQAVPGPSPEDQLQRKMELQQFRDCLEQLPLNLRRLILGRYIHGKSIAELAIEENLTPNEVSAGLYRGKQQLQDCISHKQHPQTPPGQPLS